MGNSKKEKALKLVKVSGMMKSIERMIDAFENSMGKEMTDIIRIMFKSDETLSAISEVYEINHTEKEIEDACIWFESESGKCFSEKSETVQKELHPIFTKIMEKHLLKEISNGLE